MGSSMHDTLAAAAAAAPGWLAPARDAARQAWAETPLPTRKTEQWKYTSNGGHNAEHDDRLQGDRAGVDGHLVELTITWSRHETIMASRALSAPQRAADGCAS